MKSSLRASFFIGTLGFLVIATIAILLLLPLQGSIMLLRKDIDSERETIASLKRQQQNIASVSKVFDQLTDEVEYTKKQFLNEKLSVAFYNSLDALFSSIGIFDQSTTLEPPKPSPQWQTVTIIIQFNGTYDQALSVMRKIGELDTLVTFQEVTIASPDEAGIAPVVTLTGRVPWETS